MHPFFKNVYEKGVKKMELTVTTEAMERFQALSEASDKTIRINGELVGGCGMNVEYFLWWDEAFPDDLLLTVDAFTFVIDKETLGYIGSTQLKVDYRPQQGFRLVTPEQILAYGLQVKERWGVS